MTSAADLFRTFGARRLPMVLQSEAAECSLACLAMVASFHGMELDVTALRRRFSISMKGTTLKHLMHVANKLNMNARAVRLEIEEMAGLQLPAILHWKMSHFVVLKEVKGSRYTIHDPSAGVRVVGVSELSSAFTGVALEIEPTATFRPERHVEKLRLEQLWSRITGFWPAMGKAAMLTLILQAWSIGSPFLMQIVIDDILPRYDFDFLVVLVIGFGIFALINAIATGMRQLLFLSSGTLLGFQIGSNLARHLLKLPITYFERRHSGDIISRFNAITPIQNALTSSIITAVVDGSMAVITLGLMLIYSPWLTLIAVVTCALLFGVRGALFRAMRSRNDSTIVAQAKHDTYLLETVRGIATLRLFSAEGSRHSIWQNRMGDIVNAKLGYGKLDVIYTAANQALIGLESVISIYVAVRLALGGGFSVGMIYAYIAYKNQFIGKTVSLVDRWIEFKMLDLYLQRLADIALQQPDQSFSPNISFERTTPLRGEIILRGVMYRYGDEEPWVLSGIDLAIQPGEHVAIVGPSGCGKTTLLKIALSLVRPLRGEVLIDGEPISRFGVAEYRRQIAAVMQSDQLFAGSLADNIAFFDATPDMGWVRDCARAAAIDHEIDNMPMRYETLVGDMGAALSGGQKQRILLARALYQRPRAIFLDEGTSHLDAKTELAVSRAIRNLGITRVVVAHRQETVRHADRVIELRDGKVFSDRPIALTEFLHTAALPAT